MMASIKYKVYT